MAKRYELNDQQWARIAEMLPGKKSDPGRTAKDNRLFVNGVLWVLRSGAQWDELPERYGKWKSVHKRFTRWAKSGVTAATGSGTATERWGRIDLGGTICVEWCRGRTEKSRAAEDARVADVPTWRQAAQKRSRWPGSPEGCRPDHGTGAGNAGAKA